MSEDQKVTPLEDGVEYTATLRLSQVGGTNALKIELIKEPKEFLEGDPDELVEMPMSFAIMDELTKSLLTQLPGPAEAEAPKKPHLTVVH